MGTSRLTFRRRRPVTIESWSAPPRRRRRLWQLCFAIAGLAALLAIARDPLGRFVLVVVAVACGELALVKACLFLLVPIGDYFAETEGVTSDVRAVVATLCVMAVTGVLMFVLLVAGIIAAFTVGI